MSKRKTVRLELLEADKVDDHGDYFPLSAIRRMVEDFMPGAPVSKGFDLSSPRFGKIRSLELEGKKVFAKVDLDVEAARTAGIEIDRIDDDGFELASGVSVVSKSKDEKGSKIEAFFLTCAVLTKTKIK